MPLALFLAAQMAMSAPGCAVMVAPSGEFDGWVHVTKAAAATGADGDAPIPVGTRIDLALAPGAGVKPAVMPHQPAAAGSFGGFASFVVARPGTYHVAIAPPAWIEVIDARNQPQRSVAHRHGPACSPIRKIVDFTLAPGTYRLQVTGSATPTFSALVAPKP